MLRLGVMKKGRLKCYFSQKEATKRFQVDWLNQEGRYRFLTEGKVKRKRKAKKKGI